VRYRKEHLDARREVLEEHRRLLGGLIEGVPESETSVESPASSRSREEPAQEHAQTARPSRSASSGRGNPSERLSARPLVEKDVG
jgi:hypothetical protein